MAVAFSGQQSIRRLRRSLYTHNSFDDNSFAATATTEQQSSVLWQEISYEQLKTFYVWELTIHSVSWLLFLSTLEIFSLIYLPTYLQRWRSAHLLIWVASCNRSALLFSLIIKRYCNRIAPCSHSWIHGAWCRSPGQHFILPQLHCCLQISCLA